MGQPTSSEKSRRVKLTLLAFFLGAGLLLILTRTGDQEMPVDEASHSPTYGADSASEEEPVSLAGIDEEPAEEAGGGSLPENEGARPLADQVEPGSEDRPDRAIGAEAAYEAAQIDKAIERALLMKELEQGIEAARANPGLPPTALAGIRRSANTPVPIEVLQAAERVVTIPPEILEAMEPRETPDEIEQALREAKERGTSEAIRLYMAGEGPPPPGWAD